MRTVWACEIEPSARAIYSARLGGGRFDADIREARNLPPIDILTGGFPCQDLSVAGKRGGLAGSRSGLFFELARILAESRPEWFVFENVPGLLSSNSGRDMGVVLSTLVELGYGVAWRILNAQFFGVAQRRRRVFLVGHSSGDERRAAAVLFEPAGMRGNPSPKRAARGDASAFSVGGFGGYHEGIGTLRKEGGDIGGGSETLVTGTLGTAHARNRGLGQANEGDLVVAGALQRPIGGHRIDAEGARDNQLVVEPAAVAFNWQAGGSSDYVGGRNAYTDARSRCQTPAVLARQRRQK